MISPGGSGHKSVSVIIPALNEAENLPYVLPRIPRWVDEVILVDGHSTDDTVAVATKHLPCIRIIDQEGHGKGAALRTGCNHCRGDIVIMLDADGSTDPCEIPAYVGMILAGADFAKGSRFLQGGGSEDLTLLHQLGNYLFVTMANMLFGSRFTDITYGYNACRREHLGQLALDIDGWACEIVGNIRAHIAGLHIVEVPSFERKRIAGEAKLRALPAGMSILRGILGEYLGKLHRRRPKRPAPRIPLPLADIDQWPIWLVDGQSMSDASLAGQAGQGNAWEG